MDTALSLKQLISAAGLPLDSATINLNLLKLGFLEKINYQSTTGSGVTKSFNELTKSGLRFGVNQPSRHEFRTEPRFYIETFAELLILVSKQISCDVATFAGND